jgi:hypothetical protein
MAGRRHPVRVYDINGKKLPSVTSVIARTDHIFNPSKESGLAYWRSKEPNHRQILEEACRRGSIIHSEIELALTGRQSVDYEIHEWIELGIPDYVSYLAPVISALNKEAVEVEKVVSHPLGYAGTADVVGVFEDQVTLIDWKTTRHHSVVGEKSKKRSHYKSAEIQVSAYAAAYNQDRRNPPITQGLIVVSYSWKEPDLIRLDLDALRNKAIEFQERLEVFQVLEGE